jgi:hypothetical protein
MGMSLSSESEIQTTVLGKKNGITVPIPPSKQGLAGAVARMSGNAYRVRPQSADDHHKLMCQKADIQSHNRRKPASRNLAAGEGEVVVPGCHDDPCRPSFAGTAICGIRPLHETPPQGPIVNVAGARSACVC